MGGGMGLARIVEIDTTGGPGFGFQHFKQYDFLHDKEIVLTFDDRSRPYSRAGSSCRLRAWRRVAVLAGRRSRSDGGLSASDQLVHDQRALSRDPGQALWP